MLLQDETGVGYKGTESAWWEIPWLKKMWKESLGAGRGERWLLSMANSPLLCHEYLGQGQETCSLLGCSLLSCLQRRGTGPPCQGCDVLLLQAVPAVHSGCCSPFPAVHGSIVGLLAVLIPCVSALWLLLCRGSGAFWSPFLAACTGVRLPGWILCLLVVCSPSGG